MDGCGKPMFTTLEASNSKRMNDGYEDMKPKEGLVGGIYRQLVNGKRLPDAKPNADSA